MAPRKKKVVGPIAPLSEGMRLAEQSFDAMMASRPVADDTEAREGNALSAEMGAESMFKGTDRGTNPGIGPTVQVVQIGSPQLITMMVGSDYMGLSVERAYVRIVQTEFTRDDEVEALKADLFKRGAKAVRVMPRPKGEVLLQVIKPKGPRETLRGACQALVEAAATRDRAALLADVEATMSKVGF